jgi:RNA polymerase sigma-70 factor (ECF subfamily)
MTGNDVRLESMRTYLRLVANRIVKPISPAISVSDIVQDALISACRRIQDGSAPDGAEDRGWLISILVNKFKDRRRWLLAGRRDARKTVSIAADYGSRENGRTESPGVAGLDVSDALEFALSKLVPDQRRVIELRLLEDLEFDEVALRLGVTAHCARKRYDRALAQLDERFRSQFGL